MTEELVEETGEHRVPDEWHERMRLECEAVADRWERGPLYARYKQTGDPRGLAEAKRELDRLILAKIDQLGAWFVMLAKVTLATLKEKTRDRYLEGENEEEDG